MQIILKAEIFRSKSGLEKVAMINETENIHLFHEMNQKLKSKFGKKEIMFLLTDINLTNHEMKIIRKSNEFYYEESK